MGNKCSNHPDRESIAPCHSCGKHFCKDCLIEGKEYFYCKEDKCQAFLKKENSLFEVTGGERTAGVFTEKQD